jgi:hypothetical protein
VIIATSALVVGISNVGIDIQISQCQASIYMFQTSFLSMPALVAGKSQIGKVLAS